MYCLFFFLTKQITERKALKRAAVRHWAFLRGDGKKSTRDTPRAFLPWYVWLGSYSIVISMVTSVVSPATTSTAEETTYRV